VDFYSRLEVSSELMYDYTERLTKTLMLCIGKFITCDVLQLPLLHLNNHNNKHRISFDCVVYRYTDEDKLRN